jgi:hypothetical protein
MSGLEFDASEIGRAFEIGGMSLASQYFDKVCEEKKLKRWEILALKENGQKAIKAVIAKAEGRE